MLDHPVDLVATYRELLAALPLTFLDHPLLTITKVSRQHMMTTDLLEKALTVELYSLELESYMYTLHGLRRGGKKWPTGWASVNWTYCAMVCGPATPSVVN